MQFAGSRNAERMPKPSRKASFRIRPLRMDLPNNSIKVRLFGQKRGFSGKAVYGKRQFLTIDN